LEYSWFARKYGNAHHDLVSHDTQSSSDAQYEQSSRSVVGSNGLWSQRQEQQEEPRRGNRKPCTIDCPRLAGLQFAANAGILAKENRQCSQETTEITSSHIARNAQCFNDAIGDWIG
jgi:hypothetical protein